MTPSSPTPTSPVDDGGPAYPQHDLSGYGFGPSERGQHGDEPDDFGTRRYTVEGMSLRDWFAGRAIASIPLRSWDHLGPNDEDRIKAWARCAYLVADALLTARKGGGERV